MTHLAESRFLILLTLFLVSCDGAPLTTDETSRESGVEDNLSRQDVSPFPGFELDSATLSVDGEEHGSRISLATDSLVFFFVFLDGGGLFTVSAEPFTTFVEAGRFVANELTFAIDGFEMRVVSMGDHILQDQIDRPAFVEHLADFEMFGPGVDPADVVVGLASTRNQIPGWDRR